MAKIQMSREKIITGLDNCVGNGNSYCKNCPFQGIDDCADILFEKAKELLKENEPAPSANDTSSKCNELQINNTINLAICQENR